MLWSDRSSDSMEMLSVFTKCSISHLQSMPISLDRVSISFVEHIRCIHPSKEQRMGPHFVFNASSRVWFFCWFCLWGCEWSSWFSCCWLQSWFLASKSDSDTSSLWFVISSFVIYRPNNIESIWINSNFILRTKFFTLHSCPWPWRFRKSQTLSTRFHLSSMS